MNLFKTSSGLFTVCDLRVLVQPRLDGLISAMLGMLLRYGSCVISGNRRAGIYLPKPRKVERLTKAATGNRYGHRDATVILVAYRPA